MLSDSTYFFSPLLHYGETRFHSALYSLTYSPGARKERQTQADLPDTCSPHNIIFRGVFHFYFPPNLC